MALPVLTPENINEFDNLGGGAPNYPLGSLLGNIVPSNLIYITELSDFPNPVAGVITLLPSTTYLVMADVDITPNVIVAAPLGDCFIIGLSSTTSKLRTSNASPLLGTTGAAGDFVFANITFENLTGEAINYDGGATGDLDMNFVKFVNSVKAGTFINVNQLHFHYCDIVGCADGFTFGPGTFDDIHVEGIVADANTGTFTAIEIVAGVTTDSVYFHGCLLHVEAGQTAFDIDNAITFAMADGRGSLFDNVVLNNGGTALANLLKSNPRWKIDNNSGILDSRIIGQLNFVGNAAQTTGNMGNYEDVAGAFLLAAASERFDEPVNGQLRYIGEDDVQVSVRASGSIQTTAGTDLVSVQVWLDPDTGVFAAIAASEYGPLEVKAAGAGNSFAIETIITMSKDHILKVRARNETDNSNLLITTIAFTVVE